MKKGMIFLFLVVTVTGLTGCALYGSEKQYEGGDWYLFAGSGEVARIKGDKLAFAKLESQPVETAMVNGVSLGYKGVVANLDTYRTYNFIIKGPETKAYLLGPKEIKEDSLIPGAYTCLVYSDGHRVGNPWIFHVGPQRHYFSILPPPQNLPHWFVYVGKI